MQQVSLITGGNSGVGFCTALGLAKLGHHVFVACRSQSKAMAAIARIQKITGNQAVEYLPLQLDSLASVRDCVRLFLERNLPLHILVNNAGIFAGNGLTREGFESIWGTNYLGHFLLTYLLLEKLSASSEARIIVVASDMALRPKRIAWQRFVDKTPWNFVPLYELSKACLVLLTGHLSRILESQNLGTVTVNAVHPGFVRSNITIAHRLCRYLGIGISPEVGAYSSLWTATSSELAGVSGKFFDRRGREFPMTDLLRDREVAQELWERSLRWTGCTTGNACERVVYDGSDDIFGPYALNLSQDELAGIRDRIRYLVLPKLPLGVLFWQFLKAIAQLQFGSIVLMVIQCWKRQFYMERHLDSPDIQHLCRDENLHKMIRAHLGDRFCLWRSELWLSYPARQIIPFWHRDAYPHLLRGEGKTLHIYIALTDVTAENGFAYIPKCYLSDCQVSVTDPFSGNAFFTVPEPIAKKAVPVVMQAGEFILFTDTLLHRSACNTSGQVRLSLTLRIAQPSIEVSPGYTPFYHPPIAL